MKGFVVKFGSLLTVLVAGTCWAEERMTEMHAVSEDGVEDSIGQITIKETDDGLAFYPELQGLSPGLHGFHIHENPDCGPDGSNGERGPALAAGAHYDPEGTGAHKAPWEDGHMGDLPALYVDSDQRAAHPVFVSGLELDDIKERALMIHEGGDNYADDPKPSGGGGPRVACGIITR